MDLTLPFEAPARPFKKRVYYSALAFLLVAAFITWLVIRGTWADTVELNPRSSSDGALSQLFQTASGDKQVRCALLVEFPIEQVWKVVTDYDHFDEIFPYVHSSRSSKVADGRYHLTGVVSSILYGDWAFDTHVQHTEAPGKYVASWDQAGGELTCNRGNWTLTAAGENQTLIVYTLEVEVRNLPRFLIRNVMLDRVKSIVTAVDERLKTLHGQKA